MSFACGIETEFLFLLLSNNQYDTLYTYNADRKKRESGMLINIFKDILDRISMLSPEVNLGY
jgi:hypothetical protein